MKTLGNILQLSTNYLQKNGISKSRVTAEHLLSHFLNIKRIELYMQYDRPLEEHELVSFREGLKRKGMGEPLEYILGEVEFFHAKIKLSPRVLIPRQETEILLDLVAKRLDGHEKVALDLCTGSGCIAIGLKKAFPEIEVVAVDLSKDALEVAKSNGELNDLQIDWILGDLLEPVKKRKFDLVICNPPYISEKEYEDLPNEVKGYEPKIALTPGMSGYEIFDKLAKELPSVLNDEAKVFFELGYSQGEGLLRRFSAPCWSNPVIEKDWAGHDRFFSSIFLENE